MQPVEGTSDFILNIFIECLNKIDSSFKKTQNDKHERHLLLSLLETDFSLFLQNAIPNCEVNLNYTLSENEYKASAVASVVVDSDDEDYLSCSLPGDSFRKINNEKYPNFKFDEILPKFES